MRVAAHGKQNICTIKRWPSWYRRSCHHPRVVEMAEIPAGSFSMGSSAFYPEEGPVREVCVDEFMIDRAPVTVAEFEHFVAETGYVTLAERPPAADDYPDADPDLMVEGSAVFHPTSGPVRLNDPSLWWAYVPGRASIWRPKRSPTRVMAASLSGIPPRLRTA